MPTQVLARAERISASVDFDPGLHTKGGAWVLVLDPGSPNERRECYRTHRLLRTGARRLGVRPVYSERAKAQAWETVDRNVDAAASATVAALPPFKKDGLQRSAGRLHIELDSEAYRALQTVRHLAGDPSMKAAVERILIEEARRVNGGDPEATVHVGPMPEPGRQRLVAYRCAEAVAQELFYQMAHPDARDDERVAVLVGNWVKQAGKERLKIRPAIYPGDPEAIGAD